MPTTANYDIYSPATTDGPPDSTELGAMASSVDAALVEFEKRSNYYVGTSTERTAALADVVNGAAWYDTTNNLLYWKVSGAWVAHSKNVPFASAAGVVTVTVSASSNGSAAVVFPTSRFTVAPIVSLTPINTFYNVAYDSVTATGFNAQVRQINNSSGTASVGVQWQALQMTATTAAG